jgi:MSHA pilin protein MshC
MKRKQNDSGFTMVELISVLIIVAIMSVYAIGQLNFTSVFSQKGVYDKLRAGLEYAGKAAVAQRRYVCVCVGSTCATANSATFTVDTQSPDTVGATFCGNAASQVPLTLPAPDRDCGGASNAVCSKSNATIAPAGGVSSFKFNPQGQASASVGITVTGQNNLTGSVCGGTVSVCVNGVTGYVQ